MNQNTQVGEIDLSDEAALASMLAELDGDTDDNASQVDDFTVDGVVDLSNDAMIEAAIASIEGAGHEASHDDAVQPTPVVEPAVKGAKGAKPKKSGKPKAEKPKVEKKADEPKEPKPPRVTYVGNKVSDVLKARLGDKTNEMLVLELEDAELDAAALEAKQAELLKLLNTRPGTSDGGATQKKVAEKIVMLFGWLKNGGSLNKVMDITFQTLLKDGEIVSGEKGNLWTALLAKPYSKGTANAQGGQMMAMLPMLKIATKSEKGKLVANPNSLILMAVKARMGL